MVKGVERGVEIRAVRLISKTGGKSGTWERRDDAPVDADAAAEAARAPATGSPAGSAPSGSAPGERAAGRSALVLTASDGVSAGVRDDASGDAIEARLTALGLRRRAYPRAR